MESLLLEYGWDGDDRNKGWNNWINIRCPFHDDDHASARFHPYRDRFECFACDISGDIFDVVQYAENFVDVRDARDWILRTFDL